MPIVWRLLLKSYFQVFLLSMTSFVGALYVMRFKEIAEFATLHSDGISILLFSLYQLPYTLPLAIPISCAIASTLLFQRLSHYHELTALRAAGLSLRSILMPLILSSVLLSAANFLTVSEIGPRCRLLAKELTYEMSSNNPFYIFSKITEGKLTNAYVELQTLRGGKKAQDVLLLLNNRTHKRLGIMTADELSLNEQNLLGKNITLISSLDSQIDQGFDHLVIENQESMSTPASSLSSLLQASSWSLRPEYLTFKELLIRISMSHKRFFFNSHTLEIARRLSLSLTPLFFTLVGAAFGMDIGRKQTKKSLMYACLLISLYLAAFIGAKSMKHSPAAAWALYFAPFIIITFSSLMSLKRISGGVE